MAGGEIAKEHLVAPARAGVQFLHRAGIPIGGKPLRDGVGLEKGPVDAVGRGAQDAQVSYGSGGHGVSAFI
ncbi:hypothetical protein D3C72_2335070 [compost metagenome]